MSLRVLHILDHSLPLQSGYSFRTVSILREQRALGWETHHLTTPKQGQFGPDEETVDGWHFLRTTQPRQHFSSVWGLREWRQMQATAARIEDVVNRLRPDILHAHSPVLVVRPPANEFDSLAIPSGMAPAQRGDGPSGSSIRLPR